MNNGQLLRFVIQEQSLHHTTSPLLSPTDLTDGQDGNTAKSSPLFTGQGEPASLPSFQVVTHPS